jgi:peptidoglycan hydrolase-like protein with peptidoglycan-binding domain
MPRLRAPFFVRSDNREKGDDAMNIEASEGRAAESMDATATTEEQRQDVTARTTSRLVDVRVGGHRTFDRVVFEFTGPRPGFLIRYVPQVFEDGSGDPVPLKGRAFIEAILRPAVAHDDDGSPTFPGPLPVIVNTAALRDIADAGDFEGQITWGIGVAARTPLQIRGFDDPSRIAIDIAHTPPGTGNQLLRRGDRGAAVATWQWRLRLVLERDVAVDEIFGPDTESATRDFQRDRHLTVDGIVGPRTRAAMEEALGL